MLTICTYQYRLFKKKEIWFYNGELTNDGDYTTYCYVQKKFNLSFDSELKEQTTVIDLQQDENQLFPAIHTTFRYHIRKAESLNLRFIVLIHPSVEDCNAIMNSFKEFAKNKKIEPMNKRRILALQQTNNIIITKIKYEDLDIVTHVYLFDMQHIMLMHTFHDGNFTNAQIRGYANKYLHWKDILLSKEMNFKIYDFGGINRETVPGISRFKLSYGGALIETNSYTRIAPWLKLFYKLFIFIR